MSPEIGLVVEIQKNYESSNMGSETILGVEVADTAVVLKPNAQYTTLYVELR